MSNETSKAILKLPSLGQVAWIYRLPEATLKAFRQRGCDVFDARQVFETLEKTSRKPDEWREYFENQDDSHEYWKLQETKEKVEGLKLKNAKAAGEMFDKSDGEKVQDAWASALQIALSERKATVPQILAGKDEAWISEWMEEEDRKLLSELSDLESGLWKQVYEKYSVIAESGDMAEDSPANEAKSGRSKAKT